MRILQLVGLGVFCMLIAPKITIAKNHLQIPSLIGDHMVIQSGTASLWGGDQVGQKVVVTFLDRKYYGKADAQGRWEVLLTDLEAGGPYDMKIQGSESVVLHDVLVGEVWFGSGQSNMEMTVKETRDAKKAIAGAKDLQLRLFHQERVMGLSPLQEPKGQWVVCSPEKVKNFSAVAYYYGRELRKDLKVPVGLIAASWGGSYIESWIPEEELMKLKETQGLVTAWKQQSAAGRKVWSSGLHPELQLSEVRFIPKNPKQEPLTILLAPVGNNGERAIGGTWVGEAKEGSHIEFTVLEEKSTQGGPIGRLTGHMEGGTWGFVSTKFKRNGTTVDLSAYKALEFFAKGNGEFFIFLPQPSIKDSCYWSSNSFKVTRQWKSYRINFDHLKHDSWGKPTPFTQTAVQRLAFGAVSPALSNIPDVLYNGMVAPATKARIRGVLWYQGEANEWDAKNYHKLLPVMIASWRKAWRNDNLAFLVCQLPDFRTKAKEPVEENWPLIREAQSLVTKTHDVEMAVLLGVGDANDIHPKNKTEVGKRLEKIALHMIYGKNVEWTGPRFESMVLEGSKARIQFKYAEKGLKTFGGDLKGFEVAGKDGKYYWAKAKIEGYSVVVWCEDVLAPKAVRYAWADNPDANLAGKNGLPAAPFRTDDPLTVKKK
jgi:sialate O-acetylesterase